MRPLIFKQKVIDNNGNFYNLNSVKEHLEKVVESDNSISSNVWNEKLVIGSLDRTSGNVSSADTNRVTTSFIPVKPNTKYFMISPSSADGGRTCYYDVSKKFVYGSNNSPGSNTSFTTVENAYYMRITLGSSYGITYNNDISIIEYEEGKTYSYVPYIASNKTLTELNGKIISGTFKYTPTMTQYSDNKLYRDVTDKSITVNGITSNSIIYIGVTSNNKAWVGRVSPAKNTVIRLDIFSVENITSEMTFQYIAINL